MPSFCWFRKWFDRTRASMLAASRKSKYGKSFRPSVERLENRLAPSVSLSISNPAPFPEGDTGTSDMMFVVTRSGDLGPAVQVDFTTQDGTGANGAHAGTDYVGTSGTLRFAANQTTATIAVPVIGNTIFQNNRTFRVMLSDPLASADFAGQQTFAAGIPVAAVVVGDVNGDGLPDLVVVGAPTPLTGFVSVLLNTTAPGATTPAFARHRPSLWAPTPSP